MTKKGLTTFTAVILMIAVISAGVLTYGTNAAFADGTEKTTEEILEDNGLPVVYINIGDTRVAIDELKKKHTTAPEVTGGYLLAMWPYYKEAPENVFATERGLRFGM